MRPALLIASILVMPLSAQVKITQGENRIAIEIDGKPYTELFYGPDVYKPYLHPLRAATGTIVTRHFPMEPGEGESKDHPHHRGLWFGPGDVNGINFWSNDPAFHENNMGRVVLKGTPKLQSGDKSGTVRISFEWRDPKGAPMLTEDRTMTFYAGAKNRIIDFDFTLTPVIRIKFGDTKEGTFAMRLAAGLEYPEKKAPTDPPRTGLMVNSEGGKGEKECWGHRAKWMDYSGDLKGEKVGIAIFDNPANPRYPTYWHTRGYGLFAANIFGVRDFTSNPAADGSMTVEPGKPLRFRYRVIIHPGDSDAAGIERLFEAYASGK